MLSADIVVVDDDDDIRNFLQSGLIHQGYNVRGAADAREALNLIRLQKPDVIILDFMMPDMTGEELCKKIKKTSEFSDITVFMLSARSDLQTKLRCFESGADEYLVKPVDPLEIAPRIERFLKLKPSSHRTNISDNRAISDPALTVGRAQYGPYRVEGMIGRGGMGQVFKGHDALLDRPVAIKVLSKQLFDSPQFVERFRREARLLASIDHAGIATIFTFGEEAGEHYFAMQWCSGGSLSELIHQKKRIDVLTAVSYVLECSRALSSAARKGIVHRDIKPSNLMFDEEGALKLVDFGLAFSEKTSAHITGVSQTLGTPSYMSPEQSTGQNVDHRSDMYSLGITFYHMLYGQTPFVGKTSMEVIIKQATQPIPPFNSLGGTIPRAVYAVIERLTQKDPQARYQEYDDLIRDLTETQKELLSQTRISEAVTIFERRESLLPEAKKRYGVYTLEANVGEDFMGKVFRAYDAKLQRFAALRILSPQYCSDSPFLKNLERRMQQLTSLKHPGIGSIYDFGREGDEYYLAQEWCPGNSLANLVRKKGRLGLGAALPVVHQCAEALAAAHSIGILHGNIRPNNILFDENQKIRIVDLAWADVKLESRLANESGSHFMAPERANTSIDVRVDIYSLGVLFYYMLYGMVPLNIGGGLQLPPYDDLGGSVSQEVYGLLQRMTHPEPSSRYGHYSSLMLDLEKISATVPLRPPIVVPSAQNLDSHPSVTGNSFFEILCKLYGQGKSGVLVLKWSVLQIKFLVRQREIVFFESNQPAKNIWNSMARAHLIRKEEIPAETSDLFTTLRSFLDHSAFTMKDFHQTYHQLMKESIDEVFIWPQCEAEFYAGDIENSVFPSVRIADVLLEAARGLIDDSVVRNHLRTDSLIRRTPSFEQLLSSFNLTPEESFLAYRVEGEDTSLQALQALTGFPQEKISRFVYLMENIGAIQLRSSRKSASGKKRVEPQYRVEVVQDYGKLKAPVPSDAPALPTEITQRPPAPAKQAVSFEDAIVRSEKDKKEMDEAENRKTAENYFRTAQAKSELGDYWHAAHFCQKALEHHADEKYYQLLAECYARHPRFQKDAEEAFHQAIRLAPLNPDYQVQLAKFYLDRKLYLRARTHCEKALALIPDQKEAQQMIAFIESKNLGNGGCWCMKDEV